MTNLDDYPNCTRPECAQVAIHRSAYHECDPEVKEVSESREFEKIWDQFFEKAWDSMVDLGMPYPALLPIFDGVDDEDDLADDFRDWFTNEVIRRMVTRNN